MAPKTQVTQAANDGSLRVDEIMHSAPFIIPNEEGEQAEKARTGEIPAYEKTLRANRKYAIKQLENLSEKELYALTDTQSGPVDWDDMLTTLRKQYDGIELAAARLAASHHVRLDHLSLPPGSLAAPTLENPFGNNPKDDPALYQEDGSLKPHKELAQMFAEDDIRTIAQTLLNKKREQTISC